MIVVYRQAIQTLMEVNPLAEHIDLKVVPQNYASTDGGHINFFLDPESTFHICIICIYLDPEEIRFSIRLLNNTYGTFYPWVFTTILLHLSK